jgi:hypothetical protein
MKNHQRLALVVAAAIGLGACESDFHHGLFARADVAYADGYYDDFYGPFYDGYWGDGDVFYYRAARDGDFRRDDAHHFTRSAAGGGFHNFHVHAAAPPAQGDMHSPRGS